MEEQDLKNRVGGILQQRIGELISELETNAAVRQARLQAEIERLGDLLKQSQERNARLEGETVETHTDTANDQNSQAN